MGQWVKPGEFRQFISSRVMKGLGCGFRSEVAQRRPERAKTLHNQECGTGATEGSVRNACWQRRQGLTVALRGRD
jgi:hypothetical protein